MENPGVANEPQEPAGADQASAGIPGPRSSSGPVPPPSPWQQPAYGTYGQPSAYNPPGYGAPDYGAPPPYRQPGYGQPPQGQPGYRPPAGYSQLDSPHSYAVYPGQPPPGYPPQPGAPYVPPQGGYSQLDTPMSYPPSYPQGGGAAPPGYPPYGAQTYGGPSGYPVAPSYPPYPNYGPYDPNASLNYYFPQPKPPRRGRTAAIVSAVLVVVLLVCGLGIYGLSRMGDPGGSTAGGSTGSKTSAPLKVDTTTLNGVLYQQSAALLSGDSKGFLAIVDPSAGSAVAAYARIFHNMRQMHVTIWEQSAPTGNYVTSSPQPYEIDVTYCVVVARCQDTYATWHVTAELKGGRVMIESFIAPTASRYTSEPYPWEVATLTALTGPRVVVAASDAEAGTLSQALLIAERAAAAADQYAHWGKPAVYVLYLASPSEGKTWFDGDLANADGVTYTIQPHDLQVVALMPDANEESYAGPGVLNAVVQHEFGHVATLQGDTADRGHDSFIEGIAEYCAYNGHPNWATYRIQDVRAYLHTGKWQHTIYLTSEITSKDVLTGSAAYGIGYLGLRYIAETYGLSKMLDFWGSVERDGETPQQASTSALGKPWTTVDAAAVNYIESTVGA